jgi:GntR family transcriptional regulator
MLLDVGVITSNTSGRRGFKVSGAAQGNAQSRGELLNYFYQQSVNLIWKGMAAGISAEEMYAQLSEAVDEVYGQSTVAIYFVECNEQDSKDMGQALHRALGVRVDCGVLENLRARVAEIAARYDLIVTTFHHMSEVLEMTRQAGGLPGRVVGIDTRPTPETMLGIARFPKRCIGLVSTMANTSHMLKYIIYSYHPDWHIEAVTIDEPEAVLRVAQGCDHLVVTHTCTEQVQALTGRKADVVVNFQIDEQSILFLRQRIQELQREKMVTTTLGAKMGFD